MIVLLAFIAVLLLPGMKIASPGTFHKDYTSKKQTSSINGIFTLLVFLSHVSTYISLNNSLDIPYTAFKEYMLQTVVVPFLFYSGFGIMESIKKGSKDYVKRIPKDRFLKVLFHLDLAVIIFLVINSAFGKNFPLKDILLSFIGYSSVGNSSWYIFAILGLYLIVFISFIIAGNCHIFGVVLSTALSVAFVYLQFILKRDSWCFDTIILFSVGMIFSLIKSPLEKLIIRHDILYIGTLAAAFAVYSFFSSRRAQGFAFYSMWIILFMALVVLLTIKIKIGNKILSFFGSHVFSIYILQRIPMIILSNLGLNTTNKYAFVIICFAVTVGIAVLFDRITDKLDKKIFKA